MTTLERSSLERALTEALADMPDPARVIRLDERVAALIASSSARPSRLRRPSWRHRRLVIVAFAVVAIVTVAAGGVRLLERLSENYPGWQRAWDRAVPLNLRDTVNGRTVTIEGAYLDANVLVMGLTAEGYSPVERRLRVDGRASESGTFVGTARGDDSAQLAVSYLRPGVGERANVRLDILALDAPGPGVEEVRGPWRFAFDLTSAGGISWTGTEVARSSGVAVTLDRLVISPTTVRGDLRFEIHGDDGSEEWISPIGTVRHGGREVRFNSGSYGDGSYSFVTDQGFDDESGTWVLSIDELVLGHGDVRLAGPWVFDVRPGD